MPPVHTPGRVTQYCVLTIALTDLLRHDELQDMSTERKREDLSQQQAEADHTTNSTKHLESLHSGCGLDERIKPSLPRLVEESWLHLRGWNTARVFDD